MRYRFTVSKRKRPVQQNAETVFFDGNSKYEIRFNDYLTYSGLFNRFIASRLFGFVNYNQRSFTSFNTVSTRYFLRTQRNIHFNGLHPARLFKRIELALQQRRIEEMSGTRLEPVVQHLERTLQIDEAHALITVVRHAERRGIRA